jgi:hypothetical protein
LEEGGRDDRWACIVSEREKEKGALIVFQFRMGQPR